MKHMNQQAKYGNSILADLDPDQLIDDNYAALFLGVTPQWLRCSRMTKPSWVGPPFVRVGKRAVRYRVGTLNEFIAARMIDPADKFRNAS